jgi:hypothetical protein
MGFSNEDLQRSFNQFSGNTGPTSAEDVYNNVAAAQNQAGTAGHQADHYQVAPTRQRELFANAGQDTHTNTTEQRIEAGLEAPAAAEQAEDFRVSPSEAIHMGAVGVSGEVTPSIADLLDGGQPAEQATQPQAPQYPSPNIVVQNPGSDIASRLG